MSNYNSVGMMNDGTILVVVREENTPIEACFDRVNGLKVGNMSLPNPTKNKEHIIKIVFKA
ncbi:hypothetical protein [Metasolibacillus sp.]|uniref:hypothetical protein n=1 Tax=Metasolibacillus sp. TaxID=2703680 RepID=UPI0025F15270|nr:hypothetical protein [Metasolibacillus sp.]MCT6922793.1 hypothetical protein [Metasolibacillus sp.]MCT6938868.1 hypothetical protein [Metasolibacillus sp.]